MSTNKKLPTRKQDLEYWENLLDNKLYWALRPNDFIFGGFVRDYVVNGKIPKDIDICIEVKENQTIELAAAQAFERLQGVFGISNVLEIYSGVYFCQKRKNSNSISRYDRRGPSPSNPQKKEIWHKVVLVRDNPTADWVELDLVLTPNNDPYEDIDVDLNCFKLGLNIPECEYQVKKFKSTTYKLSAARGLNLINLIEKCRNGKFTILDKEVSHARLDTLRQRGYDVVEQPARVHDSISNQTKEKEKMSKTVVGSTFMEMSKSDAKKAGVRVAAKTMSDTTKRAVIAFLRDKKMIKKNQENVMMTMLDTELGTAAVQAALGYALTYMPGIKNDPRAAMFAEEFRVSGMATVGNEVAGAFMGQLLPQMTQILSSLPALGEADEDEDEVVQAANTRSKTA